LFSPLKGSIGGFRSLLRLFFFINIFWYYK
jgi:hypothetical protein